MRWRGTTWYNVTVMHIRTVIGGKARYHVRRWPYVVWVSAVCTVHENLNFDQCSRAVCSCELLYPGGIYYSILGVHNVSVWGKGLSLDLERRDIYPVCEVHGVFHLQLRRLSFPSIPGLSLRAASQWTEGDSFIVVDRCVPVRATRRVDAKYPAMFWGTNKRACIPKPAFFTHCMQNHVDLLMVTWSLTAHEGMYDHTVHVRGTTVNVIIDWWSSISIK